MPVERHEQDGDSRRNVVGWLRARVADGEEERARLAAASMAECDGLRAEVAMLRSRIADVVRLLEAAEEAAPQIRMSARAEGWRAGYDQRAAEEESQGPPPRSPGERHLRIVGCAPAVVAGGRALLRHKVALSAVAAGALITAATVPAWHTAEFRVGVPGRGHGPSVVAQAFAPQQGRPSSPPGHDKSPHPTPAGSSHGHGHGSPSPGPKGTPPGHASPSPSPAATTADPGTPSATPAADPDPSGTPAAACTPG